MIRLAETIPAGTHDRLVEHYGPPVRTWLRDVEHTMKSTAARCEIAIDGFHDAGWASVVALGHYPNGDPVIVKALPDPERYYQERAALAHWAGDGVCRLLGFDEHTQILLIELIGGVVGGASRPCDDTERVADALPRLHRVEVDSSDDIPTLRDYYRRTVLPRIEQRANRLGAVVGANTVRRVLSLGTELCAMPHHPVMLHTDLYADNVLFNTNQNPVFIDPHPKIGSPAFDWAVWCVYYRQDGKFPARMALSRSRVPDLAGEIAAWSATLAVDGALYFSENNEPKSVAAMRRVLASPELARLD